MNLGQEIRKRRLALGWSQQKLASKAGVHLNSISAYENGKREPYLSSAILILNAMGYNLAIVPMAGEASVRPQGEWIRDRYWSRGAGMGEEYGYFYKCSLCEYEVENGYTRCGFNFCPYCGEDMRKGADDE